MNPKIVVLGSRGMIGNAVVRYFNTQKLDVLEINREGVCVSPKNKVFKFDVLQNPVSEILNVIENESTIINLIGVIRHKIDSNNERNLEQASLVNSVFPLDLVNFSKRKGCRVIQVATDCIFSGNAGNYTESSIPDPVDFYGRSKLAGEAHEKNLLTLRVSVIGHELTKHIELLDWVLRQPSNSQINGFTNHIWNGITSLTLARILEAEIKTPTYEYGTFHIVPEGQTDKFQLIKEIALIGGRADISIKKLADEKFVNRTLLTDFEPKNREIWERAGYPIIPSISMMLQEYFDWEFALAQGK
jgi:dTDP-4-dehydrorhamnose reductase